MGCVSCGAGCGEGCGKGCGAGCGEGCTKVLLSSLTRLLLSSLVVTTASVLLRLLLSTLLLRCTLSTVFTVWSVTTGEPVLVTLVLDTCSLWVKLNYWNSKQDMLDCPRNIPAH